MELVLDFSILIRDPAMKSRFAYALLLAIVAALGVSVVARGDLWLWSDHVRPPISLERALEIAKQKLGDDHKHRYCVSVTIYGNPGAKPKPGAWNLLYAAADSSKKLVYVDMDGDAEVRVWNEAIDWTENRGRREGLADVKSRLKAFFEKERLDVKIDESEGVLRVSYKTRKFQIHRELKGGEYDDKLVETIGPMTDGFIIEITNSDVAVDHSYHDAPYWTEHVEAFPLRAKNRFIRVQIRQGSAFKEEFALQLEQIFGREFQNR